MIFRLMLDSSYSHLEHWLVVWIMLLDWQCLTINKLLWKCCLSMTSQKMLTLLLKQKQLTQLVIQCLRKLRQKLSFGRKTYLLCSKCKTNGRIYFGLKDCFRWFSLTYLLQCLKLQLVLYSLSCSTSPTCDHLKTTNLMNLKPFS